MNDLPLTLLRLGLLALLWIFIFSIVGVLRSDLYGTAISRRGARRALARQEKAQARADAAAASAAASAQAAGERQDAKAAREDAKAARAQAKADAKAGKAASRNRNATPTSLVVTDGPLTGTTLPLRGSGVLVGRNPECALVLDDDYASGRHARIYPGADGWMVEDLGSTNGTYLGGAKLTSPQPVHVGSQLRIGQTVIELRA